MESSNHKLNEELIHKYNVQVPRYTSYPSLPHWQNMPSNEEYPAILNTQIKDSKEGLSLYVHLPYCESLCTYCGCNTRITVNHQVEEPYLLAITEEWNHYRKILKETPVIKEIHLGGGTPTFFSPENLVRLITNLLTGSVISKEPEFAFEAHPGVTTYRHLEALAELGFTRVSFGVQDFNQSILKAINRHQQADQIEQITRDARSLGYHSVNYDFVYGLPFQKRNDIVHNAEYVKALKPDRIAFYSYAHVPWKKQGQRHFTEKDLPSTQEKLDLYETGRELFLQMGYKAIGMDHFAFPEDALCQALENKTLSRNFMGYVPHKPGVLIGLGCSAISDTGNCYMQNKPVVEDYMQDINQNKWAYCKGHLLTPQDIIIKNHITNLMCFFETRWDSSANKYFAKVEDELKSLSKEGLLEYEQGSIKVTQLGRHFVRNICAAIDPHIEKEAAGHNRFSKAI